MRLATPSLHYINACVALTISLRLNRAMAKNMVYEVQCSPLNSNSRGPTKLVLIMRCSNYVFALNIKCKYNGFSRDHNHMSELTGFLNLQSLN